MPQNADTGGIFGTLIVALLDLIQDRKPIGFITELIKLLESLKVEPTRFNKEICQEVLTFYFQARIVLIED